MAKDFDETLPLSAPNFVFGTRMPNGGDLQAIRNLAYSAGNGVTAHAGGGALHATQLVYAVNVVEVCASNGDSVKLPQITPGQFVQVENTTAHSVQVFPYVAATTIDGVSGATGMSLGTGDNVLFRGGGTNNWVTSFQDLNIGSAEVTATGTTETHTLSDWMAFWTTDPDFPSTIQHFGDVFIDGIFSASGVSFLDGGIDTSSILANGTVTADKLVSADGNDIEVTATGASTASTLADWMAQLAAGPHHVNGLGILPANSGATNTAALNAAWSAYPSGSIFYWGAGDYAVTGSLNNQSKQTLHIVADGATWNGGTAGSFAGMPALQLGVIGKGLRLRQLAGATADDFAIWDVVRVADYTGSSKTHITSTIRGEATQGANTAGSDWVVLGILTTASPDGRGVAGYFQANRSITPNALTGATWGIVAENKDTSGTADPAGAQYGAEIDVFANGTDASEVRIGCDLIVGRGVPGGTACTVTTGFRIVAQSDSATNGRFTHGFIAQAETTNAFRVARDTTKAFSIETNVNADIGLDLVGGIYATAAISVPSDDPITLNDSRVVKLVYNSSVGNVQILNGTTQRIGFAVASSAIYFGGNTTSFPSLKRSSAVLQCRLADDSDFTPLQGILRSHANAVAGTPTATHTISIQDANGTAYRILAVV